MATPGKAQDMPIGEIPVSEFLEFFADELENWVPLVRKAESKRHLLEVGNHLRVVAAAERQYDRKGS